MIGSYYCDVLEARDMSAVSHKAGRLESCIGSHSNYEAGVRGRRDSSREVVETLDR